MNDKFNISTPERPSLTQRIGCGGGFAIGFLTGFATLFVLILIFGDYEEDPGPAVAIAEQPTEIARVETADIVFPGTPTPEVALPTDIPTDTPTPLPSSTPTVTPTPSSTPEPSYGMGQDVFVGDVRWQVISAEQLGAMLTSDNEFVDPVSTSGKFVRVRFAVENRSSSSVSYGGVEIVDDRQRAFTGASDIWHWIPDEEECIFETLNPNVPKVCNVIFDVAADATNLKLRVGDLELFGSDEAEITLGF